jgi:hypothetical protein
MVRDPNWGWIDSARENKPNLGDTILGSIIQNKMTQGNAKKASALELENAIALAKAKIGLEQNARAMNIKAFRGNSTVPMTGANQSGEVLGNDGTSANDYTIDPNYEITGEGKMLMLKPEAERAKKIADLVATENAKPYTGEEIKIASGMSLIPQIDKLIKLAEENNVYGEGKTFGNLIPFGGSRISAFGEAGPWQSFKRGLTAGKGREAGLILQDIKQIMFSTGGQALTDPEIVKLGPKMEPSYKTEEQWIADLRDVKQRLLDKARLLRPNPNEAYGQPAFTGGGGAQYMGAMGGDEYQTTPGGNKYKVIQ